MIKFRVEHSAFLAGVGVYVSKKTWNVINDNKMWLGSSLVFHFYNRMFRLSWVTKEIDNADV